MSEMAPVHFFSALQDYLERGIGSVEGWLWPTTASMIAELLVRQVSATVLGDVCEIGVHHGRLFLILANAMVVGERAVAVDVFEAQDKNLDASGAGDRRILERHIALYAPGARCEIIQESSLDLEQTGFCSSRFRFISIDGGHMASIVVNDLRLAERTLLPAGIVALDDVLNHAWPGVVTGLSRYLTEGGTLVPFAIIPNKLLLAADQAAAQRGKTFLRQHFPLAFSKSGLEFLGGVVDCYVDHPYYNRETGACLRSEIEDLRRRCEVLAASQSDGLVAIRDERDAAREALDAMRHQHEVVTAELAGSRDALATLHASRSWQITGPLRGLVSLARYRRSNPGLSGRNTAVID